MKYYVKHLEGDIRKNYYPEYLREVHSSLDEVILSIKNLRKKNNGMNNFSLLELELLDNKFDEVYREFTSLILDSTLNKKTL